MKILWLDLNSSYAHSSLALPSLQAQLINHKQLEWDIISATINENPSTIATEIYQHRPDIIAATCWLFNHEQLIHILARAHALLPMCRIVLGGPEFLGDNETFLRNNSFVDAVFRGEGEESFAQWIKVWNKPEAWQTINGLCYIDIHYHLYHDNGLARIKDFQHLTPPEESPLYNWDKPFVQLETTRGCFNTCAFCVSGGEKPVRTLPIDHIRERIRIIQNHHIHNIRILDRTFNYNNHHAKGLLNLFREFPDVHFHLEVHPALLNDELKNELASMPPGQLHIEAGIQSLHQNVLTISRRNGSLEESLKGLKFLCSLDNIETHADLIAGLPLYHLNEIFEDIRTLAAYQAGEIQLELLKLLPGTKMQRHANELGICYSPLPPYEVLSTKEITPDELQTARMLSRLLDGFYNTKIWQNITRKLIIEQHEFLSLFLNFLIKEGVIDQPMSQEKRGLLLYQFCQQTYPSYETEMTLAWIEAGMSLKKQPAYKIRSKHIVPPENWKIIYGTYQNNLRLISLPSDKTGEPTYWYGFEIESQNKRPIFKAIN
ncbi:MAG TPA: DUF4080 domain-containing protein [Candidatus Phocaeicola gallistercoris]|nr:DUF4080 domain-containing protein [Candidatus Phocaeicola gallistercoris]